MQNSNMNRECTVSTGYIQHYYVACANQKPRVITSHSMLHCSHLLPANQVFINTLPISKIVERVGFYLSIAQNKLSYYYYLSYRHDWKLPLVLISETFFFKWILQQKRNILTSRKRTDRKEIKTIQGRPWKWRHSWQRQLKHMKYFEFLKRCASSFVPKLTGGFFHRWITATKANDWHNPMKKVLANTTALNPALWKKLTNLWSNRSRSNPCSTAKLMTGSNPSHPKSNSVTKTLKASTICPSYHWKPRERRRWHRATVSHPQETCGSYRI